MIKGKLIFSVLILFICTLVQGQMNIKIGYELDYMQSDVNRTIVEDFNNQYPFLDENGQLSPIRFIHGLDLGLAYRIDFTKLELGYRGFNKSMHAIGENPADQSLFTKDVYLSFHSAYGAIEFDYEFIGIGTSFAYGKQYTKVPIADSNSKRRIDDRAISLARLYLVFNVAGSDNLSFSFKPYFQMQLNDWDHNSYANYLELAGNYMEDRPYSFGLSLTFYNGPQ